MSDFDNSNVNNVDPETQEMLLSFVSEAFDSLDTNEPIVDDLREEDNEDSVNAIFRVFHTLKGLSGFFEMQVINKVTHQAETLLDIMRKQNKPQSEDTITVIYQTFDFLRDLLQRVSTDFTDVSASEEADDMILIISATIGQVQADESGEELEEEVIDEIPQDENIEEEVVVEEATETKVADNGSAETIIADDMFEQYASNSTELLDLCEKNLLDLEKTPDNMQIVGSTFGAVHSLKGNSGFMGYSEIEEISMDMETILDSVRSGDLEIDQNLISLLLSNIETIRDRIQKLSVENGLDDFKPQVNIKEAVDAVKNEEEELKEAEKAAEEAKQAEIKANEEKAAKAIETKKKEKAAKPSTPKAAKKPAMNKMQKKDIRVETNKIDKLFDLVGELITIETMVTNNPDLKGLNLPNFNKSANQLNKITRELQEISMSIRMMPLEGLFNKMKRLVRDVSIKMGKKVNFMVSGQETEMDKNVIDEIADPLVHILRNAIDHGIEPPEKRVENSKKDVGNVSLSARYEGNEILIIVQDDGAGINRDVILRKAEEKGILNTDPEQMTDSEVFSLIFEPGFSTAKQLTDISGRGVGMDVVKKNIEKLRGRVTIESKEGKGSIFTLRIPLTLAIMEAMLIRIGTAIYALPILSLKESFRTTSDKITKTMDGLEMVKVRKDVLPIIRLHEIFSIEPESRNIGDGILMILESRSKQVCLFADEIVGQQQAVIKGLSNYIGKVPGITGCMVLGDGGIGLILDIESMIALSENIEYQIQ